VVQRVKRRDDAKGPEADRDQRQPEHDSLEDGPALQELTGMADRLVRAEPGADRLVAHPILPAASHAAAA
jgi:hypothetical protein